MSSQHEPPQCTAVSIAFQVRMDSFLLPVEMLHLDRKDSLHN